MNSLTQSYLNPKAKVMACQFGKGLFAAAPIHQGELIIDWEPGPGVLLCTEDGVTPKNRAA